MAIHWRSRQLRRQHTVWIGSLFAIGSTCFVAGPFPGFVGLVGTRADGVVFFVGSLFFTTAALLQARQSIDADRLPSLIQFAGTIFFNVSTFRALQTSIDNSQIDRLIWTPEAAGSLCFLVSGVICSLSLRAEGTPDRRSPEWRISAINLAGCVLFGISTVAAYVVPSTGDVLALGAANFATALGALCFLIGALILVRKG